MANTTTTTELWPRFKALETERAKVMRRLAQINGELEALARGLMLKALRPKESKAAVPSKAPRASGKAPTFTAQVLKLVTGPRTAPSIVASLGLKASDRRRVYKVLHKAAEDGRLKALGDGKFAPK